MRFEDIYDMINGTPRCRLAVCDGCVRLNRIKGYHEERLFMCQTGMQAAEKCITTEAFEKSLVPGDCYRLELYDAVRRLREL